MRPAYVNIEHLQSRWEVALRAPELPTIRWRPHASSVRQHKTRAVGLREARSGRQIETSSVPVRQRSRSPTKTELAASITQWVGFSPGAP